ncbi:hypothetical protein [Ensifer adhaerens]|uniref:hypothetical protein n=1 Tax=Ensifer adhaerens TaxID=106592 RepID=UPI00131A2A86|nr:hypothetical protein [Ensifer adhaerens]
MGSDDVAPLRPLVAAAGRAPAPLDEARRLFHAEAENRHPEATRLQARKLP